MRINPINGKNPYEIYAKENLPSKNPAVPVSGETTNHDRVELSSEGAKLGEAAPMIAKVKAAVTDDAAASKIQAIKQRIESGSYHVSSTDLAKAIIHGLI